MKKTLLFLFFHIFAFIGNAQDNYEIQVYGAPTVTKGATMLELHSNFTFGGQLYTQDGVLPTHNILHETVEITHGYTPWFETGFYIFNAIGSGNRTNFVGSHIRPRISVPDNWHLPLGISLSTEFGYQKQAYSPDDWTLELRPIIDKTWKKWYVAFNLALEKSLHGLNENKGFSASPNLKASYIIIKYISLGLEYYGSVGAINMPIPFQQQQHQLFLTIDIARLENFEFNAGYGLGFTNATDNDIFKIIIGYKLHGRLLKSTNI